ncbi:FecR family protein [Sphingobacterium tabacisoli]|uniref:FecR family protein n=1 Tax=Sphingobacterium tabacisoli TaxID=2044855 RepID=A0ABW5L4U7_9SPHI|nr:FecR family protein [Sphingobacterium tabacisoli]
MENDKIQTVEKLFYKIYTNTASIEERYSYYEMILEEPCAQHVKKLMEKLMTEDTDVSFSDEDRQTRVYTSIKEQLAFGQNVKRPVFKFYWAAAVALLFLFFGIYQYQQVGPKDRADEMKQDIAPGNESATLILEDGREITLSNLTSGEIDNDGGIKIFNDEHGQLTFNYLESEIPKSGVNTIKTKNGQSYTIKLADGTKVWLNAASTLQFTAALEQGGTRQVQLQGEAYFEVAKDSKHPFIVHTSRQMIRVLGTHFNVSDYPNDDAGATTVLEGRVSVKNQTAEHILNAGEQAVTNRSGTVVAKTDPKNTVDWQQGDFALNNVKIDDAIQKIARWYDVSIVYEGDIDKAMLTGGWVSKKQPLSAVLRAIESLDLVRFELKDRTLIVRPYKSK